MFDYGRLPAHSARGRYASRVERPCTSVGLREKLELVSAVNAATRLDHRIVDWLST